MPASSQPIHSLSVLMPTWQGEEFLGRVLASLAAQRCSLPWDFLAIDSGSTDRTLAILESWQTRFPVPLRVQSIHKVEFDHGDTRNMLAARSSGELLVYVTQDAIPVGSDWLATLARNFEDSLVGAAYCRNMPRPDARASTQLLSAGDPGYASERREVRLPEPEVYARLSPHEKRLLYNFNDVASAVRRELWELHPFPRTWFGEDVLLARALLEAGYTVVYDERAAVEHSHDYDAKETLERARIDGRFNAEWLGRICIESEKDAYTLADRLAATDRKAIAGAGHAGAPAADLGRELGELRLAAFRGLHEGGRSALRRPGTALLARRQLHVLYVVHGFPPDTWAGTEVYTQNLVSEMQRRGHRCTILARVPAAKPEAAGGPREFSVHETRFEGLRVLRFVHRLEHRNLRGSFKKAEPEEAFRKVLLAERPDLVHFQHLIHTSVGLVEVARELGLPTLLHCHDYWALCARVQLIRPDGVRCDENMGAGCYLCVKEKLLEQIPLAKRAGRLTGPVAGLLASLAGQEEYAHMQERHVQVPRAYAAADLLISPSRFLRQKLLDSGHFEPHRFLYSDNGMRTDHIHALQKRADAQGRVRFGFIGTLVWYKGGEVMVRAMNRLKGSQATLLVYGNFKPDSDPHHAELQKLARDGGGSVEFRGPFPNERLSEVYAEIDALVVPSTWYENSPITIHEAYLARTPVVASDIGGMAEYVREGVDGLLFEAGNDQSLARVLRRFVDEPGLIERLSRDFMPIKTIAENAAELEFRYRALLCQRRKPASALLLDAPGAAAERRFGPVERQGSDLLLLRPGGGAVEFDLHTGDAASVELTVDVLALGGESAVELGGRVLLDGRELGPLAVFRASGSDETRRFRLRTTLEPAEGGRHVLRIECAIAAGGPEAHLRLARVSARMSAAPAPAEARA